MQTPNIPTDVRYNKRLSMPERLLYGEITALSQKTVECWATNAYFAELYERQPNSISHNISNLTKYGYIVTDIDKDGVKTSRLFEKL